MEKNLRKNTISIYGSKGKVWLEALPNIIAKTATQYNLSNLKPVDNTSFNYIASGYQQKTPIIIKIGLNTTALAREHACLEAFAKQSGVQPIAHNMVLFSKEKTIQTSILIMERARPGTTLKTYFPDNDTQATSILCSVITKLQQVNIPTHHNFYSLHKLFKALDQKIAITDKILSKARYLRGVTRETSEYL